MEWIYQGIVVGVIVAGVREVSRLCAYYIKRKAQVRHLRNEICIYSDLLLGNRTEVIDRFIKRNRITYKELFSDLFTAVDTCLRYNRSHLSDNQTYLIMGAHKRAERLCTKLDHDYKNPRWVEADIIQVVSCYVDDAPFLNLRIRGPFAFPDENRGSASD